MRLRFATLLLLSVACVVMTVMVASFGVGVMEDNFVAELTTRYSSSVQFMTFYGLVNAYLLTMAYVYSPSYRTILQGPVMKDNPSLSMVNDSDEEVVYGDDDTRTPLTGPPRPHEDSD
ncbi:hypothetical protein FHG87_020305 [Trinorchestia longiramus]|nr:hypothetical protein FHG87_020305 [Trinorchestia longiramus]